MITKSTKNVFLFYLLLLCSFYLNAQIVRNSNQLIDAINEGRREIILQRGTEFSVSNTLRIQASTNIIRAETGTPLNDRPVVRLTNANRVLFTATDNIQFRRIILRGVRGSEDRHQAINVTNIRDLVINNCVINSFGVGVLSRGNANRIQGWQITGNVFRNISLRFFAINRTGDGNSTAVAGGFNIENNIFERTLDGFGNSETRGISIDGGNRGISVFNCRNSTIVNNRFINVGLALSRVQNITIRDNDFISNLSLNDEFVHIEEMCRNVRVNDNTFESGNNPEFALIDMNGSDRIIINRNVARGTARNFLRTNRYNNIITIRGNRLNGLRLPSGRNDIINIAGCGANAVEISNNDWNSNFVARVRRGTFHWNRFDDLELFPSGTGFIRFNFYYRCRTGNCGGMQVGTVSGNDPRETEVVGECNASRNFIGARPPEDFPVSKSINTNEIESNISISPNPVRSNQNITVNGDISENTIVNIYDLTGRHIYSQKLSASNNIIDTSRSTTSGLFFVEILTNNESVFSTKLIVN